MKFTLNNYLTLLIVDSSLIIICNYIGLPLTVEYSIFGSEKRKLIRHESTRRNRKKN